jgi:hypothetical protein
MAYNLEKDIDRMDKKQKAKAKAGAADRKKRAAKKTAKSKPKENWAQRLKRQTQMLLQGENYKAPAKKKKK